MLSGYRILSWFRSLNGKQFKTLYLSETVKDRSTVFRRSVSLDLTALLFWSIIWTGFKRHSLFSIMPFTKACFDFFGLVNHHVLPQNSARKNRWSIIKNVLGWHGAFSVYTRLFAFQFLSSDRNMSFQMKMCFIFHYDWNALRIEKSEKGYLNRWPSQNTTWTVSSSEGGKKAQFKLFSKLIVLNRRRAATDTNYLAFIHEQFVFIPFHQSLLAQT